MTTYTGNAARRFLCRFNLWHRWKTHREAEGEGRYQCCASCGKERDVPGVTPIM